MTDRAIEKKLKFQVRHRGQPFLEGALFPVAAHMGPIVEDQDRAVGEARTEIAQTIEGGQVDVAINADVGEFFRHLRFRAAQALFEKAFDELQARPSGRLNVPGNLLERASVLAFLPKCLIIIGVGIGETFETVEAVEMRRCNPSDSVVWWRKLIHQPSKMPNSAMSPEMFLSRISASSLAAYSHSSKASAL